MIDLLVVHPGSAHGIYGILGDQLTAVEPPLWARLIAGYVRDRGFSVKIVDAEAEGLSPHDVSLRVSAEWPRLVCLAVYGHQPSASTQQMVGASAIAKDLKKTLPHTPVIMVGGHVSALPERTLREEPVDYIAVGEGPVTIVDLLRHQRGQYPEVASAWMDSKEVNAISLHDIRGLGWRAPGTPQTIYLNPSAPLLDVKDLHGDAWDLLPMDRYRAHNWQCFGDLAARQPYASIYTSLGCPYKCLRGDTIIKTIYGDLPLRQLAENYGDAGVPVYTYDQKKKCAIIAQAINIRKYGDDEALVRVAFDDGTHIDCTPDHQMMTFRWGNNKSGTIETPVEAQNLKPGMRLRAIREERIGDGYISIACGRRWRRQRSRMVMEYALGRRLKTAEQVHHKDKDRANDHPDNLQHFATAADHLREHGEIAQRMRENNPAKHMTDEWRANIGRANTGKVRTVKHRLRYRASKLGEKNPNYKHGKRTGYSRVPNHIVVSVTPLIERDDVYCMEVPGYGWFFADNVLVKNCSFCCINAPFQTNRYRMRRPHDVVDEILHLRSRYGVRTFKIIDEMFILNERHYTEIASLLTMCGIAPDELNIWAYARIDTVKPETLALLRRAGFRWLALGIESGSKHVRDGAQKQLKNEDIVGTVRAIQAAGIHVIGNYIFGLPDDDLKSMRQTLDLACELNTEFANFYSAMAYPGSRLYDEAVAKGAELPRTWSGYSQHNQDCRPLDTEHVSATEVLATRDAAFLIYFSRPEYLDMVDAKFGAETVDHVVRMLDYKLPRKLLESAA